MNRFGAFGPFTIIKRTLPALLFLVACSGANKTAAPCDVKTNPACAHEEGRTDPPPSDPCASCGAKQSCVEGICVDQPPPPPPPLPPLQKKIRPVDEPEGPFDSLGGTLWHLGKNPAAIEEFQKWIEAKGITPEDLLSATSLTPPTNIQEILLEPALLAAESLNGWVPDAKLEFLTSTYFDNGPTVSLPLAVARAGTYRVWVHFFAYKDATALTSFKIFKNDSHDGPVFHTEIGAPAESQDGPVWKSFLVKLETGDHTIKFGHVRRFPWHGTGTYGPRKIGPLWLTDAIWNSSPPSDEVLVKKSSGPAVNGIQWTVTSEIDAAQAALWKKWQMKPLSWEGAESNPKLFDLSRQFWRERVNHLATQVYDEKNPPDYRDPVRRIVFDEDWNMAANPVRIAGQIRILKGDVVENTSSRFYWLKPSMFSVSSKESSYWTFNPVTQVLKGWYGDDPPSEGDISLPAEGTYYFWMGFASAADYFANLKITVTPEGEAPLIFSRAEKQKPPVEWLKVASFTLSKPGVVHVKLESLRPPKGAAYTYRNISDLLFTTDAKYDPNTTVRPPVSVEEYKERAVKLGAKDSDTYLSWLSVHPFQEPPLSQNVHDNGSWPKNAAPETPTISMAKNSYLSAQIGLRNLLGSPHRLQVQTSSLTGNGKNYPDKIGWRVVGFFPYGNARDQWSPFGLLNRPDISLPPYGAAGIWLTITSKGVDPGLYAAEVQLTDAKNNIRKLRFNVRVSPVEIAPQTPVLVNGYTAPPEGENYLKDFSEHGLNVWAKPMSKDDMKKWKIRLLEIPVGLETDAVAEKTLTDLIAQLKLLGLDYSDWVLKIGDEPVPANYKNFIPAAQLIRKIDGNARIQFNPGEAADANVFQALHPYADMWNPYVVSFNRGKIWVVTKPWMTYTTPCYGDKAPSLPSALYDQIRSVPAAEGNMIGTGFFAFYYPFRDAWDTAYEYLPDASVMVLPGRHGPIPTRSYEAIREGAQHADLAQMVKEKFNSPETQELISEGSVEDLLQWLEAHP